MKFLKAKWRDVVVIAGCIVAVVVTAILYSFFTSENIYKESADHLREIYEQVDKHVYNEIENERSLLKSWQYYLSNSLSVINGEDVSDAVRESKKKELTDFMQDQKEKWGFSDFFFIKPLSLEQEAQMAQSGSSDSFKYSYDCMSVFGDTEYVISPRRSLRMLLNEDRGGVVGRVREKDYTGDGEIMMMFAVRADAQFEKIPDYVEFPELDQYTYGSDENGKPFHFVSYAISFEIDKIMHMFDVDVFDNDSDFYITLSDGTVLLQKAQNTKYNFLDYLKSVDVTQSSLENVVADFTPDVSAKEGEQQKTGTALIYDENVGGEQYVTYMPIGFGDWMLIGVTKANVVNASMSRFRTITIVVMGAIFIVASAAVAWVIIMRNRRRFKEQLVAVKSREALLDLLTLNTNNIFVMFSPETFAAEYVSANITKTLGLDMNTVKEDVRNILLTSVDKHAPFTTERLKSLPVGETWETEIQLKHATSGEQYWCRLTLFHAEYDGKETCIMMFSDRTREHKLNESLEAALAIAKSANDAKSNFLANMSHDIRTPMNAILGFATLLAKDAENPEKVREYIRKISFSGQHLLSLINDILDMSKIESGKTTLHVEEFEFSEFLEELYSIIVPQSNAKNQTFDMHTKGQLPERVLGDRLRLNQVLLNLLSNAVKYTPVGGNIELAVEALKETVHNHAHLRISVKDNGIGMSEQFVKEVFDPFARESNVATKEIQGTGLGMAIAKNIVSLMGGTLNVESELGKGSTFIVEIELAIAGERSDDNDTEFWKRHNVTRVLVADDEEDVCLGVQELMEGTGVGVDYALGGVKAVQMVNDAVDGNDPYHIVLLDWKMPDMNGIEAARRIREKVGPDVSILVLTSYSFDEIEEEAKAAGINTFLPKPFFVSNFRRAIEKLHEGEHKQLSATDAPYSIAGLKVLAAEDNEINAEILGELLDIEEVACTIAHNGKEVSDMFAQSAVGDYDMIFMDIQMPIMNGYEAARAIRASSHPCAKTIPIIAMTANAFDDDVRQALDSGMNAHLAKPIDMKKLKNVIAELREGKK